MPEDHNFEHLSLVRRFQGAAKLRGGGDRSPQTELNNQFREEHARLLFDSVDALTANWAERQTRRQSEGDSLPAIPAGIPILLQVDPNLDVDDLRRAFGFEIVSEQEDGYVIVAAEDISLAGFRQKIDAFEHKVHGSATVASVHALFHNPSQSDRLGRILSDQLNEAWGSIDDGALYIVDVAIACTGTLEIPAAPKRGEKTKDSVWEAKLQKWELDRTAAYDAWEELKVERIGALLSFVNAYGAEDLKIKDGESPGAGILPDSFTVRLKISGKGLRDFVLNFPFVFEVIEPEDIQLPQSAAQAGAGGLVAVSPVPPDSDAPSVCVIDSGVQEGHVLLQPAIDTASSHCFLPGADASNVADYVTGGGHGTRTAGAVLYGEHIPVDGEPALPFWIQNARVLDDHNRMPEALFPPAVIRAVVQKFYLGPRKTRIFNHSVNAFGSCRLRHMSSWAAEIDSLSAEYDVLVVQSAGNIGPTGPASHPGVKDHLNAGREYPGYFDQAAARVSNPGQSLQALTVGSIAYGMFQTDNWRSFAGEPDRPSAFSRAGPGIWDVIKPEVVEYGGDFVRSTTGPTDVRGSGLQDACPPLVRSTMHPPGPASDRDATGTSFAAPKVARIAAELQRVLPSHSALLYRALVVQSAQWPGWAEADLAWLREPKSKKQKVAEKVDRAEVIARATATLRSIGFGLPDEERATRNTDHRTTLITDEVGEISAGECHIYQIPIPSSLRQQSDDFDVRLDVTMSYVARPRRTRRNLNHYLSTWVDWTTSKLGEGLDDFRERAMKNQEAATEPLDGSVLPWTLHENVGWGLLRGTRRNRGTVQKDWAVVKSNTLPDHFCIAVRGHQGWSRDPASTAQYALSVTFEVVGKEIAIYDPLRAAVSELQTQVESEVEAEATVEL